MPSWLSSVSWPAEASRGGRLRRGRPRQRLLLVESTCPLQFRPSWLSWPQASATVTLQPAEPNKTYTTGIRDSGYSGCCKRSLPLAQKQAMASGGSYHNQKHTIVTNNNSNNLICSSNSNYNKRKLSPDCGKYWQYLRKPRLTAHEG